MAVLNRFYCILKVSSLYGLSDKYFTVFRFADKFSKHMKWFLVVLFILGGGCFLVFALALINIIPDLKGSKNI